MAVLNYRDLTDNLAPSEQEFGLVHNTKIFTSNLTGASQTIELPGARWMTRMTYDNLTYEESNKLKNFLVKLRGSSGRFYLHDYSNPLGSGGASGASVTAAVDSRTIDCTGIIGTPVAGDYLHVRGAGDDRELKVITGWSGSLPNLRLSIEPQLRRFNDPGDFYAGKLVDMSYPVGVFMLIDDNQTRWNASTKARLTSFEFEAVEVFGNA